MPVLRSKQPPKKVVQNPQAPKASWQDVTCWHIWKRFLSYWAYTTPFKFRRSWESHWWKHSPALKSIRANGSTDRLTCLAIILFLHKEKYANLEDYNRCIFISGIFGNNLITGIMVDNRSMVHRIPRPHQWGWLSPISSTPAWSRRVRPEWTMTTKQDRYQDPSGEIGDFNNLFVINVDVTIYALFKDNGCIKCGHPIHESSVREIFATWGTRHDSCRQRCLHGQWSLPYRSPLL